MVSKRSRGSLGTQVFETREGEEMKVGDLIRDPIDVEGGEKACET
jgi:hypothetical protein